MNAADPLAALTDERFIRPQTNVGASAAPLSQLLSDAWAAPIHYPSLGESLFAGDTIAIALQHDLPRPKEVLNAVLDQLLTANIEPADITVVLPGSLAALFNLAPEQYRAVAPEGEDAADAPPVFPLEREFHAIQCQVHDPENTAGLSYLAANEAGDPVYMNRLLVDADAIIPLGCPSPESDALRDCLYPTYGSSAAIERFRSASLVARLEETELANDTLGAFFEIQLVTEPPDEVVEVVCGARQETIAAARVRSNERWAIDTAGQFEAAIVTIESRTHAQTWRDFATALIQAGRLTRADAPIVVWSEISIAPDRATRKACLARFEESIPTKLSKPLQHVASILKDRPVYFRSRLERSKVEELGLSVLETTDEILRVTEGSSSCIVLRDAHRCHLTTPEVDHDVE